MKKYYALFIFCGFVSCASTLFAQGTQVEFGKNRVQYHRHFDEWSEYESENFTTYWYGEGRFVGQFAVQMAEFDYTSLQSLLEYRPSEKLEIIVYSDLSDFLQSNIGSDEAFYNANSIGDDSNPVTGHLKIINNKIFVYFDGDHAHLRRQIREGVAAALLNAMLFGTNLQEVVQNAVILSLPEWFKQGFVGYAGEEWSSSLDDQLKDIVTNSKFKDFERFAAANPQLAGHSFWYYISQLYGKPAVSNLLYLTRINRSVESGFLYVSGTPYESLLNSWKAFFKDRYEQEAQKTKGNQNISQKIEIKNRRKLPLSQLKISPDGKNIAYVSNEIGRWKVFVKNIKTGKQQLVTKGGMKNRLSSTDYNYPLLAWKPNSNELTVVYERRDVIQYSNFDLTLEKEFKEPFAPEYQRIYSIDYIDNKDMVITAATRGLSDLFIYKTKTRQSTRLTNDFYDDLDASFVTLGNRKGILFSSNRRDSLLVEARLDSVLPIGKFDIFYMDLDTRALTKVTNTPLANERQPIGIDSTYFAYLSDGNGINNRYTAFLKDTIAYYEKIIRFKDKSELVLPQDSLLSKADSLKIDSSWQRPVRIKIGVSSAATNFSRSIGSQHFAARPSGLLAEMTTENGVTTFYSYSQMPSPDSTALQLYPTNFAGQLRRKTPSPTRPPTESNLPTEEQSKANLSVAADTTIDTRRIPESKRDTGKVDIDNYTFQSEFDKDEVPPTVILKEENGQMALQKSTTVTPQQMATVSENSLTNSLLNLNQNPEVIKFRTARISPYRLKFRMDFVTTQMDNSLLFGGLDSYSGFPNGLSYPPPGILMKANFKDLLEDYELEAGVRVPTSFNGSEYYVLFKNKKRQLDKTFAVYRRSTSITTESARNPNQIDKRRVTALLGIAQVSYPLDVFTSIRGTATARLDRITQLSTYDQTLNTPTLNEQRFGVKGEYVFDNTLELGVNSRVGTRYKFYAEVTKRFEIDLIDKMKFQLGKGYMGVVGVDARHYERLDKYTTWATRAAAATSFGSEQILYYLGGVDGWLLPKFNTDIQVPSGANIAYQTLASNMRGFYNNIRNGSSFALINTELRIPVIRYINPNTTSSFWKNLQVVGFFDVGTAWQGITPFSKDNPLNTSIISNPAVTVKVNYYRDPLVAGYGVGLHGSLFGYMVRADYAWGIETKQVQKPVIYLSLGTDF